jgi:hypothetical protein
LSIIGIVAGIFLVALGVFWVGNGAMFYTRSHSKQRWRRILYSNAWWPSRYDHRFAALLGFTMAVVGIALLTLSFVE